MSTFNLKQRFNTAYDKAYRTDPNPGPGSYENETDKYGLGSTCVLQGPKSDTSFRDFSSSFGTSQRSSLVTGGPIDACEVFDLAPTQYHIPVRHPRRLAGLSVSCSTWILCGPFCVWGGGGGGSAALADGSRPGQTRFDDIVAASSFAASTRRRNASNKGLHSHYTTVSFMNGQTEQSEEKGSQRLPRIPVRSFLPFPRPSPRLYILRVHPHPANETPYDRGVRESCAAEGRAPRRASRRRAERACWR
jgi:hypothetical protein